MTTKAPTRAQMRAAEAEAHQIDRERISTSAAQRKLQERGGKPGGRSKAKPTFHEAAVQVLQEADGPLSVKEITDTVIERKLLASKGRTPQATMATILLRGTRGKVFVKCGPGSFDLRALNPRGAKKRPTGRTS
jgi:hypothetical protein